MNGIIAAIGASFSWTYACFIWRSQANKFNAIDINFLKNLFAFIFFLPLVILKFNFAIENKYIFILFISGVLGIGLGDTFYLKSLKLIGTRKTLSIESLSPLIAAITGNIFINENLSIRSWIGIISVSISLVVIIKKQTQLINENDNLIFTSSNPKNYIFAFLSIFCAVIAALISRYVFLQINISPIITTEIRLLGGIFFLLLFSKFKINFFINKIRTNEKIIFIISILLGTNFGILLQQIVFKTLPIGIGWTLLSTSPIISLFFARREEGNISREIIGTTVFLFIGLTLIIL